MFAFIDNRKSLFYSITNEQNNSAAGTRSFAIFHFAGKFRNFWSKHFKPKLQNFLFLFRVFIFHFVNFSVNLEVIKVYKFRCRYFILFYFCFGTYVEIFVICENSYCQIQGVLFWHFKKIIKFFLSAENTC